MGKKHDRKAAHMRSQRGEFTPAQHIMRDEMSSPAKLNDVLQGVAGTMPTGERATEVAYEVINEYQGQIVTGFKEWAAIQGMVEDAYRRGHSDGRASVDDDPLATYDGVNPRWNNLRDDG